MPTAQAHLKPHAAQRRPGSAPMVSERTRAIASKQRVQRGLKKKSWNGAKKKKKESAAPAAQRHVHGCVIEPPSAQRWRRSASMDSQPRAMRAFL